MINVKSKNSLLWFREDLRIIDNATLKSAISSGDKIYPIYIDDKAIYYVGSASKVWLHHALNALNNNLNRKLSFYSGNSIKILKEICKELNITTIYLTQATNPYQIEADKEIFKYSKENNIKVKLSPPNLILQPESILKADNTPYKKFTPFYNKSLLYLEKVSHENINIQIDQFSCLYNISNTATLDGLSLLPRSGWDNSLTHTWNVSEKGASQLLEEFIKNKIFKYVSARDIPSDASLSRLSPYIHYGQISIHTIYNTIVNQLDKKVSQPFIRQLMWREFAYYLINYFPQSDCANFDRRFDKLGWINNKKHLNKWQQGMTGYTLVDAGMRELYTTGYMHNRVRMIVASFLSKNLLIDWRLGAAWFNDCLFDADIANNSFSWQWVAGCGTDAAPFHRIFNPILQAQKFDSKAKYIKKYIPELAGLEAPYIFDPSNAPKNVLSDAGITLNKDYPQAIIDIPSSRLRALRALSNIKSSAHK